METALFSVSFLLHFHPSALNISHGILCVLFFFSPCSLVFSISLFLWPRLFFPQSFPFPLSLPLLLAFGLFTAYFDAQPISCQHGPCRRSAKGYFLRLRECVCVWAALIFYLRQVHISPVRCAGLQQDRDCGALTRKQLHLCSFHSLCRLTNVQAHFPQECKSSRYTLEIILPKQSHTNIYRRGQVHVFSESMQRSSCQRRFGKACNLHDFRQWLNSALIAINPIPLHHELFTPFRNIKQNAKWEKSCTGK